MKAVGVGRVATPGVISDLLRIGVYNEASELALGRNVAASE